MEFLLGGDPFLPQKVGDGLLKNLPGGGGIFQGRFLPLAAQFFQKLQNFKGSLLADGGGFPAAVIGEGKAGFGMEPHPRREHGPDGIEKGAEIPLPQKSRQPKLVFGNQGFVVQHPLNGLQPLFLSRLHGKDDALRRLVSSAEGNLHPMAGQHSHSLWNAIGIGLVNGKNSR